MQHDTYRASVIIPVYNSAGTLRRAVQSAFDQTLTDSEILIVDDGSKDATFAIACQLAKENCCIPVVALPVNRGKPHAMNTAIAEARGTWIAVLDADDWYQPDRLGTLIAAAEANGTDLVVDNQYCHDAITGCVVRTALPIAQDDILLTKEVFIRGCNPFADYNHGMLKPILRAEFVRHAGLAYRENARLAEDFLYLVEFFATGGVGFFCCRSRCTIGHNHSAASRGSGRQQVPELGAMISARHPSPTSRYSTPCVSVEKPHSSIC
jgi:succinoglycan biosynthesis protein ExoO